MNEIANDQTNEAAAQSKPYRFVSLIPTVKAQEYWEYIDKGFDLAAAEFKKYNLVIEKRYFNQYDVNSFLEAANQVMSSRPDAIFIAPTFKTETENFIEGLNRLHIPFSFVDSMIPDTNFVSYYGQDSFQSGYLAAKTLLEDLPNKSQIIVAKVKRRGAESVQTQTRYNGFLQYMADKDLTKLIEIIELEFVEGNEEYNSSLLEYTLSQNKNIKGAISFNSKIHRLAKHIKSDIKIVGYDALVINLQFLKEGTIHALIAQHPEKQTFYTVRDMWHKLFRKEEIVQINICPIELISKENIDEYINSINIKY